MFRKFYGNTKEKKQKNSKKKDKNEGKGRGHQRMSTEEQINYALQVSLQEAEANSGPGGYEANAAAASYRHQRMTTAEQINLAMQRSLEDQGAPTSPGKGKSDEPADTTAGEEKPDNGGAFGTPPETAAPAKPGHRKMNTEQAIEIAIANSLAEVRLPDGPPDTWNAEDLGNWIAGLNEDYEKYGAEIKSRGVDGARFAKFDKAKRLKSIGIRNSDHRDNIWVAFHNEMKTHQDRKDTAKEEALKQSEENTFGRLVGALNSYKKQKQEEERKGTNEVASLFDTTRDTKKDGKRKTAKNESFGGVGALFGTSEEEVPTNSGVSSLFDDTPTEKKEPKSRKGANPSFGGVSGLFGTTADEDGAVDMSKVDLPGPSSSATPSNSAPGYAQKKRPQKSKKQQSSFGGVSSLFGPDNDEEEAGEPPVDNRRKQDNPSFGGVYDIFGANEDDGMKVKDFGPGPAKAGSTSDSSAKLEEAQKKISRLEKKLEGEKRKVEKLKQELAQERQDKQKIEIELTQIKQTSKSPKTSQGSKEADNAPVEMGFISFSQEQTKSESHLHKRDPSYTGVSGLFDDLNFGSDEDEDPEEPIFNDPSSMQQTSVTPKKKDKHKRDPSFNGVLDLFDDDEAAELGFSTPEVSQIQTKKDRSKRDPSFSGVANLFAEEEEDSDDDDGANLGAVGLDGEPQKHKRDPSYTGVKDLFDDDEPEDVEETDYPKHNKNTSFSGVRDLFADEMAPIKMTNVQESQIDELKQKIQALESKCQHYERDYQDKETQVENLAETLNMKEQQLKKVRAREEELERQSSRMRIEFNEKIQEMSESKGVDSLIAAELQKSKEQLEETTEKLRNVTKNEEILSMDIQSKTQELDILNKMLSKEKQRCRDLSQNLEEARKIQQKAESELQIRRETSSQNDHQEALINQRQSNEQLRQDKADLQKELKDLRDTMQSMHDSKIRLVQNVAMELDRMRGMFVEITMQKTAHASTIA